MPKRSTQEITLDLYRGGMGVEDIAQQRGLTPGTIFSHLLQAYEKGEDIPLEAFVPEETARTIADATRYLPAPTTLRSIFDYFDGQYSYEQIRMALAYKNRHA
jgi:ATP-dependent DNA helicase RecQ